MLFKKCFKSSDIDALVVGLGNPGDKYDMTRHNAGFMVTQKLADDVGCRLTKLKFHALYGTANIGGKKVIIAQPQTYMNNSGEAVRAIMDFYKLTPDKLVVICDDITQGVGHLRIRVKGSSGGQNGLKSVICHVGTEEFTRVRVGIGDKPTPEYDLVDWVLSKFTKDEIKPLEGAVINAVGAVKMIINGETDKAMNRYNG